MTHSKFQFPFPKVVTTLQQHSGIAQFLEKAHPNFSPSITTGSGYFDADSAFCVPVRFTRRGRAQRSFDGVLRVQFTPDFGQVAAFDFVDRQDPRFEDFVQKFAFFVSFFVPRRRAA